MKAEFVKFLKTIFFQLDEKKVIQEMEKILADPGKTDEQVYKEICDRRANVIYGNPRSASH
jgi:hypothetical protein